MCMVPPRAATGGGEGGARVVRPDCGAACGIEPVSSWMDTVNFFPDHAAKFDIAVVGDSAELYQRSNPVPRTPPPPIRVGDRREPTRIGGGGVRGLKKDTLKK